MKFVGVSGYGWTGSSAMVDLLKECEDFVAPDVEFSLIKEPNGILDLEHFLVHNWEILRHDKAIRDFLNYCKLLSRKNYKIGRWGREFSKKLNIDFYAESKDYIENFIEFTYAGSTRIFQYEMSYKDRLLNKILSKLGVTSQEKMYFSKPDIDFFINNTRNYINNIFKEVGSSGKKKVVLDQAIPVTNTKKAMRYFDDIKLIIVDRDPRDIYIDLLKNKSLIGNELDTDTDSINKYAEWHNQIRSNPFLKASYDILVINFEEIIYDLSGTLNKLSNFLKEDINHINSGQYLETEISKNNIGMWKEYPDIDFSLLEKELMS